MSSSSAMVTPTDIGGMATSRPGSSVCTEVTVVRAPEGTTTHLVAGAAASRRRAARCTRAGRRPPGRATHWIGQAQMGRVGVAIGDEVHRLQDLDQRRAVVPRRSRGPVDDVVAVQRADRHQLRLGQADAAGQREHLRRHLVEPLLRELDQVHLVDRHHHVGDAQERRDLGVAARLGDDAGPGIDEHEDQVGGRRAGEHVAGVALVAGRVGQDEGASRRREVPVGDVDGDALLALGAQAVGERGQVRGAVAPLRDGGQLIGEQELGVQQQPADERRLPVVDRSGGGQPQQLALTRSR